MKKLDDYSGEYDKNLRYEDFTGETLAKLLITWGRAYQLLDTVWSDIVRERHGLEEAIEIEKLVWQKQGDYEPRWVCKALNIPERNVVAFVKMLRCAPGGFIPGSMEFEVDFKSPNHAIFTVTRCWGEETWSKTGDTNKAKLYCEELDTVAFPAWGRSFNPNLKVTPLKLPLKKGDDGIACQWEFKIEE